MGGYVAHDAVASATRSPLSLKRPSMLTWTEKGERLDGEMHSIPLFSDVISPDWQDSFDAGPRRKELAGLRLCDIDRNLCLMNIHRKGDIWQQVQVPREA